VSESCRVDFYVLQDPSQSMELLACQLALKAWEQGNRTVVATDSESTSDRLDLLMWEHPQGRFLPHACARKAKDAPILIGTLAELETASAGVLINLTPQAIDHPQRFERLLEFVPAEAVLKQASREKFRAYRSLGLEPATHVLNRT